MTCHRVESGEIELYFYDELEPDARHAIEQHLESCGDCRSALEDLTVIRSALAAQPVVAAPPAGDWSGFMRRLDAAIQIEQHVKQIAASDALPPRALAWHMSPARLAIAALFVLAATSAAYVGYSMSRGSGRAAAPPASSMPAAATVADTAVPVVSPTPEKAFAALSEQHFERSKLVVLGIANKDPRRVSDADWQYERQLASSLLSDTRLYRMAAEERGMKTIADVMGDLELVLLQASLADRSGREDLEQIQRLIHKRDLVTKMDVATSF
ncbi:MAG TPA: zf-HC2 domain-containing protein [Vicinamibacterales bacterium]|nr:zf-HC2 domain-containing protein [Vicinamibacterales bacterium]